MTDPMQVRVTPNGPVLIPGPVRIETASGEVVESDRFMVAICTCRRSKIYPMCDTSHRRCRPVRGRLNDDVAQTKSVERSP